MFWVDGKTLEQQQERRLKKISINIENVSLEPKDEILYLGIIFNKQFHFRKQVDEQIKRASNDFHAYSNLFRNKILGTKVKEYYYTKHKLDLSFVA